MESVLSALAEKIDDFYEAVDIENEKRKNAAVRGGWIAIEVETDLKTFVHWYKYHYF